MALLILFASATAACSHAAAPAPPPANNRTQPSAHQHAAHGHTAHNHGDHDHTSHDHAGHDHGSTEPVAHAATTAATEEPLDVDDTGLPAGFVDEEIVSGLDSPTAAALTSDGRAFIAEKSGLLRVFETADGNDLGVVADLRVEVYNHWDRGLLGVLADPQLTEGRPYLYVAYSYDSELGSGTHPRWGSTDPVASTYDPCPNPPGANTHGCSSSARVERLTLADSGYSNTVVDRTVLVEDWCMQFPSHSIGDIAMDDTGALIVSGGDGASFGALDWGQWGWPTPNPCDDPPGGPVMSPPHAQGGTLRAQSVRRADDAPVSLSGSIVRIDADTGAAAPGNPAYGHPNENRARIISAGHKNPYRFALRPNSTEIWAGDVGLSSYEEINRIDTHEELTNFGFPCYEGPQRHPGYDAANLTICEELYTSGDALDPYVAYSHDLNVAAGDDGRCPPGAPLGGPVSSSITGLTFYDTGNYPTVYHGGLFFADYARECIWVLPRTSNGDISTTPHTFATGRGTPVQLSVEPHTGNLLYVDLTRSSGLRRISYVGDDAANTPHATFTVTTDHAATAPATVTFDASSSHGHGALTYTWDFGDGATGTGEHVTHTYNTVGNHRARLRVTDENGLVGTRHHTINVGGPTVEVNIDRDRYRVGEPFTATATATDASGDSVEPAGINWHAEIQHCSSAGHCHSHHMGSWSATNTLTLDGPDHPLPSYVRLTATAANNAGVVGTRTVELHPETAELVVASNPPGAQIAVGMVAPGQHHHTFKAGSATNIAAPVTVEDGDNHWVFDTWSDGEQNPMRSYTVESDTTLTATYRRIGGDTVAGTAWHANGGAQLDNNNSTLQLTGTGTFETGSVVTTDVFNGEEFHVVFDADFGNDPWGADGMTFAVLDSRHHNHTAIGATGSGLGFAGLTGTAVVFDTYSNAGEPDTDFVGVVENGGLVDIAAVPNLAGNSRHVNIWAVNNQLHVAVDAELVLTRTWNPDHPVRFAFTAATGGLTNAHSIHDVTLRAQPAAVDAAGEDLSTWIPAGSAHVESSTAATLTPDTPFQAGALFSPTTHPSTQLTVNAELEFSNPWGADGAAVVFADPDVTVTEPGSYGWGVGYAGIDGAAVVFDTYSNEGEPGTDFVGIATGHGSRHLTYTHTAALPTELALKGHRRHVTVAAHNGTVRVSVDGTVVLEAPMLLPENTRVGFSAGTGGLSSTHRVEHVHISTDASSDTVEQLPNGVGAGWVLGGAANVTNDTVTLTNGGWFETGSMFWHTPTSTQGLNVTARVHIADPWGADGVALVFASHDTAPGSVGAAGAGMGVAGIDGVAVMLDTHANVGDPSNNFVAIASSAHGTFTHLATATMAEPLGGREVELGVTHHNGVLRVTLDGTTVLEHAVALPPHAFVGFTGSTGGLTNTQRITDVTTSRVSGP